MRAPLAPRQREAFDRLVLLCDERQAGVEDLVHLAQLLLECGAVVVGVGALGEERAVQLVQRLAVACRGGADHCSSSARMTKLTDSSWKPRPE